MLKISKKIAVVVMSLPIFACSNLPPDVNPTVSLIPPNLAAQYSSLSPGVQAALNGRLQKTIIDDGKVFTVGKVYFSALGTHCAQVKEKGINNHKEDFSACQMGEQWQKLPSSNNP